MEKDCQGENHNERGSSRWSVGGLIHKLGLIATRYFYRYSWRRKPVVTIHSRSFFVDYGQIVKSLPVCTGFVKATCASTDSASASLM